MRAGDFTQSLQLRQNAGKASIYNSRIGKFTQPDTIIPGAGNPQAFNRYAYVLNNPVNFVDPSGHVPICLDKWCQNIPPVVGASSSGGGGGDSNGNSTGNASGAAGEDLDAENDDTSCGSYPGYGGGCTESFYDIQKQTTYNVLSALEICQSPHASFADKAIACGYLGTWGVVIGATLAAGKIAIDGIAGIVILRFQYEVAVRGIAENIVNWRSIGLSTQQIARNAWELRRELGVRFKDLTPQPLRDAIYQRNLATYGDPLGPTWEYLITRKTFEQIISSASRACYGL